MDGLFCDLFSFIFSITLLVLYPDRNRVSKILNYTTSNTLGSYAGMSDNMHTCMFFNTLMGRKSVIFHSGESFHLLSAVNIAMTGGFVSRLC